MNDPGTVGPSLRRLRMERSFALATVAERAGISIATLSRVETNKQSLEVGLLLTLARILDVPVVAVLGGDDDRDDVEALSRRLGALTPDARAKVFRKTTPRRKAKDLQPAVDELIATVEMLRDELVGLQRAMRRRGKR